jgi:hypothetical protein
MVCQSFSVAVALGLGLGLTLQYYQFRDGEQVTTRDTEGSDQPLSLDYFALTSQRDRNWIPFRDNSHND